jgi:hypothetical protein
MEISDLRTDGSRTDDRSGRGFLQRLRGAMPTELTAESEKAFLENRVEILARELENANKRLAGLNAPKES